MKYFGFGGVRFVRLFGVVSLLSVCFMSVGAAQTLLLKTENYPPFNMLDEGGGEIIGISTEIVETLFERALLPYELELLPWNRAFDSALNEANTGVFSTTRTAEREEKFKWVGPLVQNKWVFLAKAGREITISSLEDAKQYRIGGYTGDAVALYLADQGFELDLVRVDELNALKIDRNRIDLWATGNSLGPYYAKQQGVSGLASVFTFRETVMSIAFNKDMSDSTIDTLNTELEKMKAEGVVAKIEENYK